MASQAERDQAKVKIDEFAARATQGVFSKITRVQVVGGFKDRVDDPTKIYQGNAGLCVPASFLYSLARDKPKDYVQIVVDLYETGKAKVGEWELKPCTDLKNYALTTKDSVPPVDWIPLASIRDSENWFIDYQQTSDRGGTSPSELESWIKKAGYTKVVDESNGFFCKDEMNLNSANNYYNQDYNVLMRLHADILEDKTGMSMGPNHRVVLASNVNISVLNPKEKNVELTVFTWGKKQRIPSFGKTLKLSDFLDSYYGFVACKF